MVSPIFPTIWNKLGKDGDSVKRRKAEEQLEVNARQFASSIGMLDVVDEELHWKFDSSHKDQELEEIKKPFEHAVHLEQPQPFAPDTIAQTASLRTFDFCLTPARSTRSIGIDQGTEHFAIVAIDKIDDRPPKIVAADLYNLHLPENFLVSDVILALQQQTTLLSWMQVHIFHVAISDTCTRLISSVQAFGHISSSSV